MTLTTPGNSNPILPDNALRLAQAWNFTPLEELPPGYCCRAFADETRVLRVPWRGEELTVGAEAAIRIHLVGGPSIYESDEETGILLMERLTPGTKLLAESSRQNPGLHAFIPLAKKMRLIDREGMPAIAEYYKKEPPFKNEQNVFLHGDLHHENILRHGNEWRPIDPKGLQGDPHFEPVAYLRNLLNFQPETEDFPFFVQSQIEKIATQLELDAQRICDWTRYDAIDWHDEIPIGDPRRNFPNILASLTLARR